MSAQEPLLAKFTYCYIAADRDVPVSEREWDGKGTDKELRDHLASHFQTSFTTGQQQQFQEGLRKQVEENEKRGRVGGAPDKESANVGVKNEIPQAVIDQALMQRSSCEIVPVIYPDASNEFKGLSLYIDSVGRYKELPLNERASKMAQRDVRGDAFVLASYDDPIKDDWARITCTKTQIDDLIAIPPSKAEDPQARAAAMQASMQTKEVTAEDIAKAKAGKDEANAEFKAQKFPEAEKKYSEALALLVGRTENLDQADYMQIKHTLLLNRAQARLKTKQYKGAEGDCAHVLSEDGANLKARYRRATAYRMMHEYDACLADCAAALEHHPNEASMMKLKQEVEVERANHKKAEKAKFGKMFA